jgi:serine/threonine protein kinase
VLDLGLALIHGEQVEDIAVIGGQGYIVGTMDYISPEQAADAAAVDRRSDIYSLGCTLYFALTGQPPFPGGSHKEKIRKHRRDEPPPVEELRPDVPLDLALLVRRMMAKDPDQRPPSASAVAADLRRCAGPEPVLPLDRPEDSEYREAVAALQTTTASGSEFSLPNLGPPETPEPAGWLDWRQWPVWLLPVVCALLAWGVILGVVLLVKLLFFKS